MQLSKEVRWFFTRPLDEEIKKWFFEGTELPLEERTDRYFNFPGCKSGGVKLRKYEDKKSGYVTRNFEIKLLQGGSQKMEFPGGVQGFTERWLKWSYGETPVEPLIEEFMHKAEDKGFKDVGKQRYLRKFSLDSGFVEEVSPKDRPTVGCGVELTGLMMGGMEWLSFALEAYGPEDILDRAFRQAADHFFSKHSVPLLLDLTSSASYPEWLTKVP